MGNGTRECGAMRAAMQTDQPVDSSSVAPGREGVVTRLWRAIGGPRAAQAVRDAAVWHGLRRALVNPRLRHRLVFLEGLAWASFIVLSISLLTLRYWVLPNIEQHRDVIIGAFSRAIGLPVRVGAIEADWRGLRPRLSFTDVRIFDRQGREALRLPSVENTVSWRTLISGELRLHALVIDGPQLAVRRDREGHLFVAGLKLDSGEGGKGGFADWLLAQREIAVRAAEILWIDEVRGAPPLALGALEFRMRNAGDVHFIGVSARPPAALGTSLVARAELVGRSVTIPAAWNGRVYAELGDTDLAGWRTWFDYPVDVRQGRGALRLWATLGGGQPGRATVDVRLSQVVAQLGPGLPALRLASVSGRLLGRISARGYEVGGRELTLTAADGRVLRPTSFSLEIEAGKAAPAAHGKLRASLIELETLSGFAEVLPMPAELRTRLAELAPRGRLRDVRLEWRGSLPQAEHYTARARFEALGMNAWGRVPGFTGLSGRIEATPARGSVELDARDAEIDLPRVFPEPRIALDTLTLRMDWTRPAGRVLQMRLGTVNFSNAHLAGNAFGTYAHHGEGPGVIDLTARLSRADGRYTAKYLPLATLMGSLTRGWLESAILGGELSDARVRLQGDLRDFPFKAPGTGQFQVAAQVHGGLLAYASGWPRIRDIDGDLLFERDRMEIVGRSGSIFGTALSGVRVTIPQLGAAEPELLVNGQADGPTQDFLRYVAESPVDRMTGAITQGMTAQGRARLKLKLKLPLQAREKTRLSGELQFADNTIQMHPRLPPVVRATGKLEFSENGFSLPEVQGRLFDGPVTLRGGTQAGGGLRVVAEGEATVGGIRTLFDHAWRTRLTGAARYTGTISVEDGRTRIRFESKLRGVASALPPPLAKPAEEELPLRVDILPSEGGQRDRISVALGQRLAAEFLRRREGDRMQVTRTAVALNPTAGATLRLPDRNGTLMYGTLEALDLDRWLPLLVTEAPGAPTDAAQTAAKPPPATPVAKGPPAQGSEAERAGNSIFELRAKTLDVFGKRLGAVTLKAGVDAGGWSANVEAAELAGDLAYRAEGRGHLTARLAHFRVPDDTPGSRAGEGARNLPSVDLIAERFTLRGKALGRVEVVAQQLGTEWRIDRLALVNPDAALHGKGAWRTVLSAAPGDPASSRTALNFDLDVNDVGSFLERIGYRGLVREGHAKLGGNVAWNAGPTVIDYASLTGALKFEADDGQFLEIEPGIGKLVSLMSLQMLPRRLTLDFRDVFSKGFKWDRITSTLAVERGVLETRDFRMRGPAAEVEMAGTTNLAIEMQDLLVRVIPNYGDTASTVVGFVNPVIGLATMIASRVLKNPLGKILAYEYSIKGSWSDPKIDRVATAPAVADDPSGVSRLGEGAPITHPPAPAPPAAAIPTPPTSAPTVTGTR